METGDGPHAPERLVKGGRLLAQAAAQAVVLLQQVDVGAVGGMRRIWVRGRPSGEIRLTMMQLGMAKTSPRGTP